MVLLLPILLLSGWHFLACQALLPSQPHPVSAQRLSSSPIQEPPSLHHRKTIAAIVCSIAMFNPIPPASAASSALETSVVNLEKAGTRGNVAHIDRPIIPTHEFR